MDKVDKATLTGYKVGKATITGDKATKLHSMLNEHRPTQEKAPPSHLRGQILHQLSDAVQDNQQESLKTIIAQVFDQPWWRVGQKWINLHMSIVRCLIFDIDIDIDIDIIGCFIFDIESFRNLSHRRVPPGP